MKKIAFGMLIVTALYAYNHAKNSNLVQSLAFNKAQIEKLTTVRR